MAGRSWGRTISRQQTFSTLGLALLPLMFISMMVVGGGGPLSSILNWWVPWALIMLGVHLIFSVYLKEVWHSVNLYVDRPTEQVVSALAEALDEQGPPFTRRSEGPPGPGVALAEVFVLEGGLEIAIQDRSGRCMVFLGPEGQGSAGEIERLKGLVDGVAR